MSMDSVKPGLRRIRKNWISILISLLIGVLGFIFIKPRPDFYIVDYSFVKPLGFSPTLQFEDLNSDKIDEQIISFYQSKRRFIINQVFASNGGIVNQYNILSDSVEQVKPLIGDYDHDDVKEIYIISRENNRLFVTQIKPYEAQPGNISSPVYLDTLVCIEGKASFTYSNALFYDVNGDGYDEMYFSINSQFKTVYPRKLYAVDWQRKSLVHESTPQGIVSDPICFIDFDKDGVPEITGNTSASANIDSIGLYEYDDHNAWFMTFDLNLEHICKPVIFPGDYSKIFLANQPESYNHKLTGLYHSTGHQISRPFVWQTESYDKIDRREYLPDGELYVGMNIGNLKTDSSSVFVVTSSTAGLLYYNDQLELKNRIVFGREIDASIGSLRSFIPNQDLAVVRFSGTNKYQFYNPTGERLAKHDFSDVTPGSGNIGYTTYYNSGNYYFLTKEELVFFEFKANPQRYLKWTLILLISIGSYLFILLINWLQRRQIKAQVSLVDKMRELELISAKNQLDPHFTFNALNVLIYLSKENDAEGIESFTQHFSKLLRRQVELSDQPHTTLFDEVRFVEHYIELQKLRFDIPINYDLDVEPNIDMNIRIPKMMLHTHIENAIKHGLIPADGGMVRVRISKQGKNTQIDIEDNGVGRNASAHSNGSTGKGLLILEQLYDLFYQLYKVRINQEFIDLKGTGGQPSGTLVRIKI
jgi:two-component system LytT family sensor kinase